MTPRPWRVLLLAAVLLSNPGRAVGQVADLSAGGVFGRVFTDEDGDGTWSEGDRPLAGVRILTSAGLVLTSGSDGGFHAFLLDSGFELGGDQVLVLDRTTLAAGAKVTGGPRRLVQLHPGLLARVEFPIRPPALEIGAARGVQPVGDGLPPRLQPLPDGRIEADLTGRAPAGCQVFVAGASPAADSRGDFRTPVALRPGVNPFLASLQCGDGHLEWILFELHWLQRSAGGDLIVPGPPRTLAVCAGPPLGALPRSKEVHLACRAEAGVGLTVEAQTGRSGREGGLIQGFRLPVHPGDNAFQVRVQVGAQQPLRGQLDWQVSAVDLLAASHGQVVLGLPLGGDKSDLTLGGSLRGALRATLPEDFQLILGGAVQSFDSQGLSGTEALRRALEPARDPSVLARRPDPERGPVAFADNGRVEALNPAGSRYFLGLRRKSSWIGWGGCATDLPADDSPGQVRRNLHGAHLMLRPLEDWFPEPEPALDLRLAGFWSQALERRPIEGPGTGWQGPALQLPAHEEFLSTGGTLYFLAHPWLVEGSVRVVAERRERFSGALVERRTLRPGLDVDVDWLAGRLLLREPLDHTSLAAGAVRLHPLGSDATILVVDYEYLAGGDAAGPEEMWGGSAVLSGRPSPDLLLSGSVSSLRTVESPDEAAYDLMRTRVEARYGDWARLWAAWAQSQGRLLVPAFSLDGGLSFEALSLPDRDRGEAWEAGLALGSERVSGRLAFRRQLNGFSDSLRLVGRDLNQASLDLAVRPIDPLAISARFSGNAFSDSRILEGRLGLGYRIVAPLSLTLEAGYQGGFGSDSDPALAAWTAGGQRALVGARLAWDTTPWLALLAGHQHAVYRSGEGWTSRDLTLTTAGGRLRLFDDLALQAEAGWGPDVGTVIRLGASRAERAGAATFAHTTFSVDGGALRDGSYVAGQSAPVGHGCFLSSTQTLGQDAGGDAIGQRLGFDAPIGPGLRLHLAYERAELHRAGASEERASWFTNPFLDRSVVFSGGPGRRNAVFARLAYLGARLQLSVSGEYRADEQWPRDWASAPGDPATPVHHRQTVATLAGRYRPHRDLALAARLAWAETFGLKSTGDGAGWPEGGLLEGSASLVYRPASVAWLRLLARAAAGADHRPPTAQTWPTRNGGSQWALASLAVSLAPIKAFQPTLAVAPWWRLLPGDDGNYLKFQMFAALRLGSEVWSGLGLAGEVRASVVERNYGLLPDEGDEGARVGAAAELFYQIEGDDVGGLRFSVGYSFSDLPDPMLTDLFSGHQGLYLRLEGMY